MTPKLLATAFLVFSFTALTAMADEPSPVGLWRTFDDQDGQAASLVRIEDKGGSLEGRVIKILPRPGHPTDALCEKCDGARLNQPVTGMTILWNMKRIGDEYTDGWIIDPQNGNTYRCTMHVSGNKLDVRGYLGISLFGRTQTWVREP
ncbi:MAG: DUF2147 domain-containing protein [Burkholderiales bacterium]|nr:DUF2147 domain-containing protein [Ferrovum sp.]